MGSNFFKPSSPKIGPGNLSLEARAIGSSAFQGRSAASGVSKDLGAAMGLNKSKFKPQKTNSAYAKGPKV